jgi:hypothetical protein
MTTFLIGLGVGLVTLAYRLTPWRMLRALDRESGKVHRAVAGTPPGPDWPLLYARLRSREIGLVVGMSVGFPAYMALCTLGDLWLGLGLVALGLPTAVGALVGHLWSLRRRSDAPRVVSLHRRELVDYLAPVELWLSRCAAVVPLAVAALGLAAWVAEPRADPVGLAVTAVCAVCLPVSLLAEPLARRTLLAPTGVSTPGGLVWAEVLRAKMLRDIVSACSLLAVAGPGLALATAVTRFDRPDAWWLPGCWLVAGLAGVIVLGRFWFDVIDSGYQWARGHAVPGVA